MAAKGQPRSGGRKKGTLNYQTIAVQEKCKLLGIDPIEVALLFAGGKWRALGYKKEHNSFGEPTIPPALRAKCALDMSEFLAPKLKSIEHKGVEDAPIKLKYETKWRELPTDAGTGPGDGEDSDKDT